MSKAKWVFLFLLAVSVAVPSYAIELSLGGFPSFMRTRARFIKDATFISALDDDQAEQLGFDSADDNIFFVDTRLRLTPQLVLSESVTIRAQVDVADNMIWGGATSNAFGGRSTVINSSLTSGDRFRGALLVGVNAIDAGIGDFTALGAADDVQFFNVRMLHADIVLPNNWGFVRIGRQPFDWGVGILANGGWDPTADLGFVLDRFLYLKSWPLSGGTFTFVLVSDRLTQGNSVVTGNGSGYDIAAAAIIYNTNAFGGNLTLGAYDFPYLHQKNVFTPCPGPGLGVGAGGPCGFGVDFDWVNLYSGLIDFKTDSFRIVGEIQGEFGEVTIEGTPGIDIDHNFIAVARLEFYPGFPVKVLGLEGGYAQGDEAGFDTAGNNIGGGNDGGLVFNPAYNAGAILFKHMIPTIYQIEGSVINAFYGRAFGTVKIVDDLSFTGDVIVAFNDETDNPLGGGEVDRYLGVEVDGILTWEIYPGVNFDLIGGIVLIGSGLEDLLEQQAAGILAAEGIAGGVDASDIAWSVQGRLILYIDQFLKK